jgi:hypothetical protein
MIKLQLINAAITYYTDCMMLRLFWKSFNCRYNPRMDYAFCLLTLKSYESSFIIKNYINRKITSYIYLLIFTKSLWLHVKHFIALTKRESVRRIFFLQLSIWQDRKMVIPIIWCYMQLQWPNSTLPYTIFNIH